MQNATDKLSVGINALASVYTPTPPEPTLETARALKEFEFAAILQAATYPSPTVARELLETRQFAALYSKNDSLVGSTPALRREAAINEFYRVERYQRVVGKRLRHYFRHWSRMPDLVGKALNGARYEIFRLLGPEPTGDDIQRTLDGARFGPGSVGGIARSHGLVDVTPYGKLSPDTTILVTHACLLRWAPLLRGEFRCWLDQRRASIVDHCSGTTVPKDSGRDRFIAVEPYLNSYIQLGQNAVLSMYLRRWGVDIRNQTWNQDLARISSMSNSADGLATLDLKSASDSVHLELVRWLIPPGWFEYLSSTRCPSVRIGKTVTRLEKFSSMGNGVTFPLETLIFSALIRSVRRLTGDQGLWACYGDDIIIGVRSAALLMEVLNFAGFKVNGEKSFIFGAFRESCGEDFLDGHGVRPIYLKSELKDSTAYAFHNVAQRRGFPLTKLCAPTRAYYPGLVGPSLTPKGDGDSHYIAPLDVLKKDSRVAVMWHTGLQSYVIRYVERAKRTRLVRGETKKCYASQSYLAWLGQQMRSGPHPYRVRDVVYFDRVTKAISPYWLPFYDPSWYTHSG